ncbi:MAG: DUF6455 family protein [Pseudomonadota bacterium]
MRVYDPNPSESFWKRLRKLFRVPEAPPSTPGGGEMARMLAEAGVSQAEAQRGKPAGPKHRRRMAAMMGHFGIDPARADPRYWGAIRDAGRVCVNCPTEGRCHRWLNWGRANDAPRVFCPNAALFDEIASDARTRDPR